MQTAKIGVVGRSILAIPVFIAWIFVGYQMGAMLSSHISMDLAQTHWTNVWVYFWLLLWPAGLAYFVLYYVLIAFVILLIVLFVLGKFKIGPFAPDSTWETSIKVEKID